MDNGRCFDQKKKEIQRVDDWIAINLNLLNVDIVDITQTNLERSKTVTAVVGARSSRKSTAIERHNKRTKTAKKTCFTLFLVYYIHTFIRTLNLNRHSKSLGKMLMSVLQAQGQNPAAL